MAYSVTPGEGYSIGSRVIRTLAVHQVWEDLFFPAAKKRSVQNLMQTKQSSGHSLKCTGIT